MSELGDVLELLHGAARRVTTLTATLLDWHDEERALRAVAAAQHHGAAIGVLQHKGEPPRQYEQRTLVHYRHPGRYRLHRQANAYVHRPHDVLQVCDGEREWTYVAAERQAYVQAPSQHELFRLLDPSWLPATCTLSVAGHTAHEGRQAVELHGRPRPDLLDRHLHHLGLGAGQADELHAVVDAETGLLLSVTSRFEGEPYHVERLTDVAIDQPLDDELFHFTPPQGVRVDDLLAREHRRPPIVRGPLRFRLHMLRRRLGHRIHRRRGRQGAA
jgi:outer membrane lipoprotein-sorting protein